VWVYVCYYAYVRGYTTEQGGGGGGDPSDGRTAPLTRTDTKWTFDKTDPLDCIQMTVSRGGADGRAGGGRSEGRKKV